MLVRLGGFGALLEGLVGFGYPWAVVAPILISLGLRDLRRDPRVAAIANNAPVSYGALGAPIIAMAAVTGYPLLALSGSVGTVVAVLALLPPWVLIYLVAGKEGLKDGWPLAIVGSLGYVAGQWPTAYFFGPYLPDVTGSIVCFCALLLLLKVWRPARDPRGMAGWPVEASVIAAQAAEHGLTGGEVLLAWMPFAVLVVVVAGLDRVRGPACRQLAGISCRCRRSRRRPRRPFRPCSSSPCGSAAARSWHHG